MKVASEKKVRVPARGLKVALVTGAGGAIGIATARALLAQGWSVALADRRQDALDRAEAECASFAEASRILTLGLDQTDRGAVDAAVAQIETALGPIVGLFANAGFGVLGTLLDVSQKVWAKHLDINVTGTFNVCQSVAKTMVAAKRPGAMVLNASSGARVFSDLLGAYCVSKAGVMMLAIGLASELGNHRIRVNCILPGVIETGMTAPMLSDDRHRQWLLAETPVGRLGLASDVAELVAFLLSSSSSFINGACVPVDGGQTIHGHPRWFMTDYRIDHEDNWRIGP